jgi:hypothetical protein
MYTTVIGFKRMITGGECASEWRLVKQRDHLALVTPRVFLNN